MIRTMTVLGLLALGGGSPLAAGESMLQVESRDGLRIMRWGAQPAFHRTDREVVDARVIAVAGSPTRALVWTERSLDGQSFPFYALSLDGVRVQTVRETSYELQLRAPGAFDPLETVPLSVIPPAPASNLYLVQFWTQPLDVYRDALELEGATVLKFLPHHAYFVWMPEPVRATVASLPFVRWVGTVPLDAKLEPFILDALAQGDLGDAVRYSIMVHERGADAQGRVGKFIESRGGVVHGTTPEGFRMEATLSLDQVREVAALDDVMFIDRWSPVEADLDIVREIGGADYVETVAGYTGQGVRAEVADTELDVNHPEWSAPPIIHIAGASSNHGTSVYGILFAQGVTAAARGIIPDAVGIFAYSSSLLGTGPTRYNHTAELVDPAGPYRAVLQTNSTGNARTFFYTTISAEMDDILFINDITITQSQSNAGNQDSRPQAWAKNIVSGGAVDHFNTLTRSDDCWSCGSGSIGPAEDGRIKPDLCFFYDLTYSAYAGGGYTQFGGTSGATPSIAGYFGLFYQMWSEQVFGNSVPNPGGTVFENRPHMTTAKAAMINTATQYAFSGTGHDMTRVHQGWGMPSAQYLYDMRNKIGFVDETDILQNLEKSVYTLTVDPAEPEVRVTLTWADPMGTPGAAMHRINDLDLKVTSPTAVEYWGNQGLLAGNYSTSGGSPDTIDTVENVFVSSPTDGVWVVEIYASEVNEDGHVETPGTDVDYALVASGGTLAPCDPAQPTNVQAVGTAPSEITVSWNSVGGATDYEVFRATSPGGPYSSRGTTGGATNFVDSPVSGDVTFYYVVRSQILCWSEDSAEASASTTGPCTLGPEFAGITSVASAGLSTCALDLEWNLATQIFCTAPESYRIYRDVTPGFTPQLGVNDIASGVLCAGNPCTYRDADGLAPGTAHYYVVRAVDAAGNEDSNGVELSGTPYGPGGGNQNLFFDDFESDLGWSFVGAGEWARTSPSGGTAPYGLPDPASAYGGSNVIGNDLVGAGGEYSNNIVASTATSPAIDCSAATTVQLSFRRWLNVETSSWDKATIYVSNDGGTWIQVWQNAGEITDSSWSLQTYDITAVAAGQSTVYVRFQLDTDTSWQYTGWNIDDLSVDGFVQAACNQVFSPGEVSDDAAHTLEVLKNGANVDIRFEDLGASSYNIYVSRSPATAPFLVNSSAEGKRDCGVAWVPDAGGMHRFVGYDPEAGISTPSDIYYILVTADNGSPTEGPLGFNSVGFQRTADGYCAR